MKLIALANLPNRVKAGESFDVHPAIGHILITAGVARADDAPEPVVIPTRTKRTYRRRDLRAED